MSTTEWDRGRDKASNLLQEVLSTIAERDDQRRRGVMGGEDRRVKPALNNLDRLLNKLDRELRVLEETSPPPVSGKDLARRREDLRRMQNEHTRLKGLEKAASASADRDTLLRPAGGSSAAGGTGSTESVGTRDLTSQQLMERTEAEIKVQDAVLDRMSEGLTSLSGIGKAISDETTLHMKLLDKLDDEVDKGNINLVRETGRTAKLTKSSASCWLYVIICVLVLVLVGLILGRYA